MNDVIMTYIYKFIIYLNVLLFQFYWGINVRMMNNVCTLDFLGVLIMYVVVPKDTP